MKHTNGKPVSLAAIDALFKAKPYFIVERSVPQGNGDSYTLYMSLPGTWSEDEKDALRFPQKILADAHAHRFHGTVKECKP